MNITTSTLRSASPVFAEDVTVTYAGVPAVRNVSLTLPACAVTALIGPSGCGKTSFLNSLNRMTDLIPTCRVSGQVRLGDLSVHDPRTDVVALRRRVGMIFQRPNPFPLSISGNLELPLREHGLRSREAVAGKIEESLRAVGLWEEVKDRLHRPALKLSGGQQQRLCLARAIALEPEVLLLDEPCSALDPLAAGVVESLIRELSQRYTIGMVTHNLARARRMADHGAFFWSDDRGGQLIEAGPIDRLLSEPEQDLTRAFVRGDVG